jgi:hypothetical protein
MAEETALSPDNGILKVVVLVVLAAIFMICAVLPAGILHGILWFTGWHLAFWKTWTGVTIAALLIVGFVERFDGHKTSV